MISQCNDIIKLIQISFTTVIGTSLILELEPRRVSESTSLSSHCGHFRADRLTDTSQSIEKNKWPFTKSATTVIIVLRIRISANHRRRISLAEWSGCEWRRWSSGRAGSAATSFGQVPRNPSPHPRFERPIHDGAIFKKIIVIYFIFFQYKQNTLPAGRPPRSGMRDHACRSACLEVKSGFWEEKKRQNWLRPVQRMSRSPESWTFLSIRESNAVGDAPGMSDSRRARLKGAIGIGA